MSLNRIVLIGHLTRNPELKYTPNGIAVANLGIAVNRITKNEAGDYDVDFFSIVAWRHTAEFAGKYLTKGRKVSVDGHLQARTWIDQATQTKRTVYEIVAEHLEAVDKRVDSDNTEGHPDVEHDDPNDDPVGEMAADAVSLPSAPVTSPSQAASAKPAASAKAAPKSNGTTAVLEKPAAAAPVDLKAKAAHLAALKAKLDQAKIEAEYAAALATDGDPFDVLTDAE